MSQKEITIWCDDNDLLMFGQFQENDVGVSNFSMCGVNSRKFTTHIVVKDLDITKEFYKELIVGSVEKGMECKIDENGLYTINFFGKFTFDINIIVEELLEKANKFQDHQKVRCLGTELFTI